MLHDLVDSASDFKSCIHLLKIGSESNSSFGEDTLI